MFKVMYLFLALGFMGNAVQAESCQPQQVFSSYTIAKKNLKSGKVSESKLELWRSPKQVAFHYPKTNITELWEQTSNNKLHLIRYFESHDRGIEYQPGEIKGGHDWSLKRQLVSDAMLKDMAKIKEQGSGCDKIETYQKRLLSQKITLNWMPNQKLVQSYQVNSEESTTVWQLTSLGHDTKRISDKFSRLASLDTTDYTDIGDNESDPFLMKMINMGFVEHGADGFYDSSGHPMNSPHKH